MGCNGCEDKAKERAIAHLTARERRDYLQALRIQRGEVSSKLLALGFQRNRSKIILCHRCSTRLEPESTYKPEVYEEFRNIILCGDCIKEIKSAHGAFCASCLRLIREILQESMSGKTRTKYVALPGGIYGGRFMICERCCYPEAPRRADQIPAFLGGTKFVPELLRPKSPPREGLGLGVPNDNEEDSL